MYRKFFGLTRDPFEISPDPYFFYPTPRHNEALANLNYGVQRRKGFVVVTGEVGTGKTLLVRCLLDVLNRNQIAFAYVFNPRLSVPDFLRYAYGPAFADDGPHKKSEMLAHLNNYLIARFRRGTTTALVVDEAQLLSWELLEEIRLLTNLETSQQKLLQIVLVGQPELDRKLDSPHLRQLKQRVGLRCRLEPLRTDEIYGYIQRRLELAGANSHGKTIFSEQAISAIHNYSKGIPRLINTLCENALVSCYAKQSKQVSQETVDEVAADFRLDETAPALAEPEEAGSRKKALKALFRMIEELDGATDKPAEEPKFESGVKSRMSRLYEALRKSELENQQKGGAVLTEAPQTPVLENPAETVAVAPMELTTAKNVRTHVVPNAHLVAMTEPQGLPAEKFRVLTTRLGNLRGQRELKSIQVVSGVVDEGKTLISANLAVTLARQSQHRVLLVEGDFHNPALHALFGLSHLKGLRQWWDDPKSSITDFLYQINDLPLWYLPAGGRFDEPGLALQSGRFAEAFAQVTGPFDWVIVDSTPLLPMADANIWNRLVDGALLVVREGVTPVNALKKGLASLDDPKLVGVVLNGASEFDRVNYYDQYYARPNGSSKPRTNGNAPEVHE